MRRVHVAAALLLAIATFAASAPVVAADLPQPPPPMPRAPAFVPAPVYNWSGFYIGINGGWGFGTSNWTNSLAFPGSTGNFDLSGGVAGGTVGANWQINNFVVGVEGDIDWSNIKGSTSNGFCVGTTCTTENTWLGTIRGRAGFAADRILFYGTAGGAFGSIKATGAAFTNTSSAQFGWTAGAGIEGALTDNLTARIEYLYVDLGNDTCSIVCFPGSTNVSFKTSLVRAGLNWKFGGF